MGDFHPEAQVKGASGWSFTALTLRRASATRSCVEIVLIEMII
jgi:hypothetical protein